MKAFDPDVAKRRFGSRHEKPCANPNMLTCALAECQKLDHCMLMKAEEEQPKTADKANDDEEREVERW